jgi:hypothetical protein
MSAPSLFIGSIRLVEVEAGRRSGSWRLPSEEFVMEKTHDFTIDVAQDARQRGRYRWSISENAKVRDTSFYSFATRQEAQADANKFVEKLNAVWHPH